MRRILTAVVAGFAAYALLLAISLALFHLVLGSINVFKPGSWEPTAAFCFSSIGFGLVCGTVGGYVCLAIGKHTRPVLILAAAVLVIGALNAVPIGAAPTEPRPAEVGTIDAMLRAQPPAWYHLTQAAFGACGVLVGGNALKRKPR